jgi:hypothetical protein
MYVYLCCDLVENTMMNYWFKPWKMQGKNYGRKREWKILMSNSVIKCFCVYREKLMYAIGKMSCEWGLT